MNGIQTKLTVSRAGKTVPAPEFLFTAHLAEFPRGKGRFAGHALRCCLAAIAADTVTSPVFKPVLCIATTDQLAANKASNRNTAASVAEVIAVADSTVLRRHVAQVTSRCMGLAGLANVMLPTIAISPNVVAATDGPSADVAVKVLSVQD